MTCRRCCTSKCVCDCTYHDEETLQSLHTHITKHQQSEGKRFSSMTRTVVGGAACSEQMLKTFVEDYGVDVLHAWGMTGRYVDGWMGGWVEFECVCMMGRWAA